MSKSLGLALALLHAIAGTAWAGKIEPAPVDTPEWRARHEGLVQEARSESIDVLFLGDSITDYWRAQGIRVWNYAFAPLKAANFGIAGDRIENVHWRIQNGEIDGLSPRVVVLLIGTNNLPWFTVDEIAPAHVALVQELLRRLPRSRILLLGLFPRVDAWSAEFRQNVEPVNARLGGLADGQRVFYLDIGAGFRSPDGGIAPEIMFDGLHLTEKGYQIWADAILPVVRKLSSPAPWIR